MAGCLGEQRLQGPSLTATQSTNGAPYYVAGIHRPLGCSLAPVGAEDAFEFDDLLSEFKDHFRSSTTTAFAAMPIVSSYVMFTLMTQVKPIFITLGCLLSLMAGLLWAQTRKAGLWEVTTTQTWQQSPLPPGITIPNSPFNGGTNTTRVCLTQQDIDKYGASTPQTRGCQIAKLTKTANGMTGDLVCTGRMSGKGTFEETAIDGEHAKGKVHFLGSVQAAPNPKTVEWTTTSSSVFKGADCGDVKPRPQSEK